MKKFIISSLIAVLVSSCGGGETSVDDVIATEDLAQLREKKEALTIQRDSLNNRIGRLDRAIAAVDTVQKLSLVSTFQVKDTIFNHFVELQGNVSTRKNLILNAEYAGILQELKVEEGQKVQRGQVLAVLDDGGLGAQLAQLQSQAELAKTTFERQKRLWDQNIGSEIQYLTAKTQFESASNAVTQLKNQLAKTRITAPFSGTIDQVIADPGANLSPGMPVIRIVSLENMYVEVEVPEIYLPNIKKGTSVRVYFPVLGEEVETKVRQVSDFIRPSNRTFNVEVGVPSLNGMVKPNLNARVFINDYSSEDAILIPQSIITENAAGEQYVYVAKEIDQQNRAVVEQTVVRVGKSQGDLVEILEGVKAGDAVIEEGARSLLPGQRVKILK
ncbi:efflux RND transporter periplasmic adaptor subunit [Robertkochia marina]|uniref:Efflux RND transporter periplasmic adaptor subunit n=1 Tax=Robertkochia marina TaxID=1227945 RepID=A0A4S3M328_9FLAO|nr:efflux RND transporter periplasmic adaptor subunit [Robertkochia marina]THD69115.1 efflux RND transporter periplasmic adaptor subunit [Robertkochia marina]TRZ47626.1 efflux RND transporter periplasmic adaptor subunit [Robertkochia marina]